jgi:molybdopterin converting factor small subunit
MMVVRLPAPLRPYADGAKEIQVEGSTVAAALSDLAARHPALRPHLFDDRGELRPFVNLFLNEEDVRSLQGTATPLGEGDRLLIVPSIAGGRGEMDRSMRPVDHTALRVNQAMIIGILIGAFVGNAAWLVLAVGVIMGIGSAIGKPGFVPVYPLLRSLGRFKPDVVPDHPEPHRFAQALGAAFLLASALALGVGSPIVGWALTWIVIGLAALNLFGGLCIGCLMYYWLSRLGVPGFIKSPPPGARPGRRPPAAAGGTG